MKLSNGFVHGTAVAMAVMFCALVVGAFLDERLPSTIIEEQVAARAALVEVFEEEAPPTATGLCQANTILSASLQACHHDKACNLNDSEMFEMYLTGKAAVIQCKKAVMIDMFTEVNIKMKQLREELRAEPEREEPLKPEVLPLYRIKNAHRI